MHGSFQRKKTSAHRSAYDESERLSGQIPTPLLNFRCSTSRVYVPRMSDRASRAQDVRVIQASWQGGRAALRCILPADQRLDRYNSILFFDEKTTLVVITRPLGVTSTSFDSFPTA